MSKWQNTDRKLSKSLTSKAKYRRDEISKRQNLENQNVEAAIHRMQNTNRLNIKTQNNEVARYRKLNLKSKASDY